MGYVLISKINSKLWSESQLFNNISVIIRLLKGNKGDWKWLNQKLNL
jgi:hypothetical protein